MFGPAHHIRGFLTKRREPTIGTRNQRPIITRRPHQGGHFFLEGCLHNSGCGKMFGAHIEMASDKSTGKNIDDKFHQSPSKRLDKDNREPYTNRIDKRPTIFGNFSDRCTRRSNPRTLHRRTQQPFTRNRPHDQPFIMRFEKGDLIIFW